MIEINWDAIGVGLAVISLLWNYNNYTKINNINNINSSKITNKTVNNIIHNNDVIDKAINEKIENMFQYIEKHKDTEQRTVDGFSKLLKIINTLYLTNDIRYELSSNIIHNNSMILADIILNNDIKLTDNIRKLQHDNIKLYDESLEKLKLIN